MLAGLQRGDGQLAMQMVRRGNCTRVDGLVPTPSIEIPDLAAAVAPGQPTELLARSFPLVKGHVCGCILERSVIVFALPDA